MKLKRLGHQRKHLRASYSATIRTMRRYCEPHKLTQINMGSSSLPKQNVFSNVSNLIDLTKHNPAGVLSPCKIHCKEERQ